MICAFDIGWLCLVVHAENSACTCCVDSCIFFFSCHLPNSVLPRLSIMQCDKCRCIWGQTTILVWFGMIGKCGKKKKTKQNKKRRATKSVTLGGGCVEMGTCLGSRFGACARDVHTWTKGWAIQWSTGRIWVTAWFWGMGLKVTVRACVSERESERERERARMCVDIVQMH